LTGLQERLDQGDAVLVLLRIAAPTIEADPAAAFADAQEDVSVLSGQRLHVADRNTLWVDANRFVHVQLFQRDISRYVRSGPIIVVREDRQIVLHLRLADRAVHFALVGGEIGFVRHVANLPVRPVPAYRRFLDQALGDLILAH